MQQNVSKKKKKIHPSLRECKANEVAKTAVQTCCVGLRLKTEQRSPALCSLPRQEITHCWMVNQIVEYIHAYCACMCVCVYLYVSVPVIVCVSVCVCHVLLGSVQWGLTQTTKLFAVCTEMTNL